jgi:hypothetical protein
MPMKARLVLPLLLFALLGGLAADDKPTSLSNARAAIDANLKTPEGKAYDAKLGQEFQEKYLGTMKQCKQSAGNDLDSFWMLLKRDKDGAVREVLLYPETAMGTCARKTLLKDRFSPPPKPDYWVGIYMKISKH